VSTDAPIWVFEKFVAGTARTRVDVSVRFARGVPDSDWRDSGVAKVESRFRAIGRESPRVPARPRRL
tara:strand:+ start:353 stop:553 length:201 start_codon:yes stop_codon:yes gene_type:complete